MKSQKILAAVAVVAMSMAGASMARAETVKGTETEKHTETIKDSMSHTTASFIKDASAAGMFEVDSSKIALEKSSNEKVKEFAQQMVDDHTKANDELKATLKGDQAKYLSKKENMMQTKTLAKLNKDKTAKFDKDYVDAQVKAHQQAVDLFTKYSEKGDDADLKAFAAKTLPTLQQHKEMIDEMQASMK